MTKTEVIAIAQRAGYPHVGLSWNDQEQAFLMRFAALVAASEREACEPLIRQLVAALEGYRRNHNDTQPCDAERAGRAWLDGAP